MYFSRFSVVKLTLFFDRMYTENEPSKSTEVISTYFIQEVLNYNTLTLKF